MRANFLIGLNIYTLEQSASGRSFKVFCNGDSFFFSDSLNDCREIIRTKGLLHLNELSKKAKDDWFKLAHGTVEMFMEGAPPVPDPKPSYEVLALPALPGEIDSEVVVCTECTTNDPHNCPTHGIQATSNNK